VKWSDIKILFSGIAELMHSTICVSTITACHKTILTDRSNYLTHLADTDETLLHNNQRALEKTSATWKAVSQLFSATYFEPQHNA